MTPNLIVLACPSYGFNFGKISVYYNETMELLGEITGTKYDEFIGEELDVLSYEDGAQTFIYSVSHDGDRQVLIRTELLINNKISKDNLPLFYMNTSEIGTVTKEWGESGKLSVASGDQYLVVHHNKFS